MTIVMVLRDGAYDAVVIDVEARDAGGCTLTLAIAAGEHRGDVVGVVGAMEESDALSLLGSACTLRVDAGMPRLELEGDVV